MVLNEYKLRKLKAYEPKERRIGLPESDIARNGRRSTPGEQQ